MLASTIPASPYATWTPPERNLTPKVDAFAVNVAHMRRAAAVKYGRVHRNNLRADAATSLQMDILGARCEAAAKLFFGNTVEWFSYREGEPVDDNLPDLLAPNGLAIDVKGVEQNYKGLIVPKGWVKPKWAYLLVLGGSHPTYQMFGWMWGHEILRIPVTEPQPGRPAHLAKQRSGLIRQDVDALVELTKS